MSRATTSDVRRLGRPTREAAAVIADAVLDSARRLFGQRGYATSMDEIAQDCGVSKLTIYRRFPSKEALLIAVIDRDLERYADAMRVTLESGLSPMDALRQTARAMFEMSMTPETLQFSRLLVAQGSTNAALRPRLGDWIKLANAPVVMAIKAAQDAGCVIDQDPSVLSEVLRDLLDGLPRRLRLRHVDMATAQEAADFFEVRWVLFERAVTLRQA
jgi:TetR/AcrR family transcriptional repressor of mexJK operon